MSGHNIVKHSAEGALEVSLDGIAAASATITTGPGGAQVQFQVAAGHWPASVRSELVNAVFESEEFLETSHVQAAVPMGDSQLLRDIAGHCTEVHTHGAGATCLLDGTLVTPSLT